MFSYFFMLVSAVLGLLVGFLDQHLLLQLADGIVFVFMRFLKMISIPLIFMALLSTISGMNAVSHAKKIGAILIKYTLTTTIVASTIGLIIFLLINPVEQINLLTVPTEIENTKYLHHIVSLIPENIIQPFISGNPISAIFLAIFFGISVLILPEKQRQQAHDFLNNVFTIIMNFTKIILKTLPLVIFGFFAQFAHHFKHNGEVGGLFLYLICIISANLIQAFVILPLFLKSHRISPFCILNAIKPAIMLACVSKSSSVALPSIIENMEKKLAINPRITRFVLPLCISINMNACAAFILITTLFVSMSNGVHFSQWELIGWIFLSTLAAIGNAGIPLGCFMLSSAILSTMNVPLQIMGIILPFYAMIDMLESGINIWSDACVTAIVNNNIK